MAPRARLSASSLISNEFRLLYQHIFVDLRYNIATGLVPPPGGPSLRQPSRRGLRKGLYVWPLGPCPYARARACARLLSYGGVSTPLYCVYSSYICICPCHVPTTQVRPCIAALRRGGSRSIFFNVFIVLILLSFACILLFVMHH